MRGFTLIELMVVIAIIAILVVIAVPSYNDYNNNQKLTEAANQLQTVLRQAQNNAQTGTVCKSNSTGYKAPTWVIKLNSDRYSVYPSCDFSTAIAGTPTPSPVPQEHLLPSGVTISNFWILYLPGSSSCCDGTAQLSSLNQPTIEYKNLSSGVNFNIGVSGCPQGVTDPNVAAVVILKDSSSTTNIRNIVIEKGGSIYIDSAVLPPTYQPGYCSPY